MFGSFVSRQFVRPEILACFLISLLVWGCQDKKPILIGFVGGTSGRVADLGISGRDAALLAVEECNQSGGISGRPVQLAIKNDEQNPETARRVVHEMIEEGVVAIIGPMTSDMAVAVAPVANEAKIPLVSPTVTTEALSDRDDYFLRVTSTTATFASRSAAYQIKSGKMRRVAAVYDLDNIKFSAFWLENFRKTFAGLGGDVIASIGFSAANRISYLDIVSELLAVQPDGILIVANSMDSAMLCQQIRKIDADVEITLADWGATERLLELGGRTVEGVTVVQTFDRGNQNPRYLSFRKAYLDRYQREPGYPGVHTYDAVQVILSALRQDKKDKDIKETILSSGPLPGLQHMVEFTAFGDAKKPHVSISIIRNQQFVVVE